MKIVKDGDMYCVQKGNFVNLQESKEYFFIGKGEYHKFILTLFKLMAKESNRRASRLGEDGDYEGAEAYRKESEYFKGIEIPVLINGIDNIR